jgi:hypothetical protein
MSIVQIRHLQGQRPAQPFALELKSGRIIQIYDPHEIATSETGHGSIGVLHGNGVFEVLGAESVVSVSVGVHEKEKERIQKWRAEAEKRFGRGES